MLENMEIQLNFIQTILKRPIPTVYTGSSVSVIGWLVSWAEDTLPVVQWLAGAVGIMSGLIAIFVWTWTSIRNKRVEGLLRK